MRLFRGPEPSPAEQQLVRTALEHLPLVEAPESIWVAIQSAAARPQPQSRWNLAIAAVAASIVLLAGTWRSIVQPSYWEIMRAGGITTRVSAGDWIETGAAPTTIEVGKIGSVELAPRTLVRVVKALPGEHRLALAHGELHASITAPPKLFFVDTASGTAIDLGCEYTLTADESGGGLLRVTRGWVAFQWNGVESLVPAGASCRTHPRAGPGIPYFDDASPAFQQALETSALDAILAEARPRDTLSLWHLLWRADPAVRARIYDRMAVLTPVPAGVSREQVLKLDPQTMQHWREELAWTW